ncbi:hypothetical protein Pint_34083 [Pistacia integerrima]|uniref:Uncharacterized protein n=1 Tax=Pistacia integerrima TaxID=434235 RepID=A0ACC0X731_9ROSI|nr:hypothetical protein Pint_34083 [Pistacia integerrima]
MSIIRAGDFLWLRFGTQRKEGDPP